MNDILYYWKSITIPVIIYFGIKWYQFNLIFQSTARAKEIANKSIIQNPFNELVRCVRVCTLCIDFIDKSMCGKFSRGIKTVYANKNERKRERERNRTFTQCIKNVSKHRVSPAE